MKSSLLRVCAVLGVFSAGPALAAAGAPQLLIESGAWRAYKVRQGKTALCYALSEPVERLPRGLRRDPAFLFVSRSARHSHDEISFEFGYPLDVSARSSLSIGQAEFELMEQNEQAWLLIENQQPRAVTALKRALVATVRTRSARGSETQDSYTLRGFSKAYDAVVAACD